ncbi:MAG: deoxyribose-phosphate aldolase, partial [Clostridiales bacterium]|nr:deoxyribose-phosphate aldolase [Clostridiales bacterium]
CTVIGFPNGYSTTAVKCFEAATAVADGAGEIDMVLHLGQVRQGRFDAVQEEIAAVRRVCRGQVLKVIIETCLLTEAEKIALCHVVTDAGADFIKTSTGFAGGGATEADVALLAAHVGPGVRVKASGGIASLQDAAALLEAGAARLGTSRVVAEVIRNEGKGV